MRATCGAPSPGWIPTSAEQPRADRADGFAIDDDAGFGHAG